MKGWPAAFYLLVEFVMANLNKVMLIGRLTRDPEIKEFSSGGKVASFGFVVDNRKKNQATGQWENEPCFLDVKAFNRGDYSKQADIVEKNLKKGSQAYIEGHLVLEQWTSKEGTKQSKLKIVMDNVQFISKSEKSLYDSPKQEEDIGF